jgi:Na+/melibiose symporter-like transporter
LGFLFEAKTVISCPFLFLCFLLKSTKQRVTRQDFLQTAQAVPTHPSSKTTLQAWYKNQLPTSCSAHNMPSTNDLSKDKRSGTNSTPGDAEVIVLAEEPASAPALKRSAGKTALIMLALCLAVFLAALDSVVITVALPTIARELGASDAGYAWIGSAYLLTVAALIPFWGKVSDIFGRKPTLIIANAIFMIGSLIAALSRNLTMLIAGRAVQGLGGGGLITLVNICIGDLFSPRERGMYLGIIGGIWAFASSIGPVLGGAFTQRVSWRWCFWSKTFFPRMVPLANCY